MRGIATLVLVLGVAGCHAAGQPAQLLTGLDACYAGGERATTPGLLTADPAYGARFNGRPAIWLEGTTGVWLADGQLEIRDRNGHAVATTGKQYLIAPAYMSTKAQALVDQHGGIAIPAGCYAWDMVEAGGAP